MPLARFWHMWNSFLTKIKKICQNQILARFRSFCILSSIWAQKSKNRAISDLEPIYLVVISQKTAPMVYFPIWRFLIWHVIDHKSEQSDVLNIRSRLCFITSEIQNFLFQNINISLSIVRTVSLRKNSKKWQVWMCHKRWQLQFDLHL